MPPHRPGRRAAPHWTDDATLQTRVTTQEHRARRWTDHLLRRRQQPWWGLIIGVAMVGAISVVGVVVGSRTGGSATGFVLVVPVVFAGLVGGRWPSYAVAVIATLSYSLRLPPVGSLRVTVTEDAVALIVLLGVGLLVSTLVTTRIETLQRLERDRAVLLRSVSHDLRTPLGTIRAAATDLLDESDGEADRATRRHLLELIDHDAQRLDRLVANLLSLSRIEADGLRPARVPTDLGELVRSTAQRLGERTGGVEVVTRVDDDLPLVSIDPVMFDQVVTNLVENAVRHSPAGTAVELELTRPQPGPLRLTVSDRGPGVAPDDAELIFQPFRSGQIAGSSGVGLAICRAILAAHGGTIHVDERPGGGARFTVELDDH